MTQTCQRTIPTPLGPMLAVVADGSLIRLEFDAPETAPGSDPLLGEVARQLTAFFEGTLHRFTLPLAPVGTPFQRAVWSELERIPSGQTKTYADIGRALNNPKAGQAIGQANANNPIAIVIPCHRVIGADGSLTGYAGGLKRKRWLLEHEGASMALFAEHATV